MPARKLEKYVAQGMKLGMGMEPSALADVLYTIASRGEQVPLHLPLGATAWKLVKSKFETMLKELDNVKEISAMGAAL